MSSSAAASTIRTFYRFVRFHVATRHVLTWLVCLIVDCTLLRIVKARPFTRLIPAVARTPDNIQQEALEHAKNICRSIYFFSGMESIAHAHFVDVLLQVTCSFFEEIQAKPELWWAQTCRKALRKRVQRMEKAGHKTLCRVVGVSQGLSHAVRFESTGRASDVQNTSIEGDDDIATCARSRLVSVRQVKSKSVDNGMDTGQDNE